MNRVKAAPLYVTMEHLEDGTAWGVAANSVVRRVFSELADEWSVPLLVPAPALCTDNGVMVAWNGLLLARAGLYHGPDLSAVPRGRAIPEDWRKV